MTEFTSKQSAFVRNKAAGMKNRDAAIGAGYAANSADVQAAQLMRREDIKKAIAKAKKDIKSGVDQAGAAVAAEVVAGDRNITLPKAKYDDSMEFLRDAMNLSGLSVVVRADYAKALLPYQHARIGEKGKKQTAKERAGEIANGGGKFKTKRPPNNVTPIGAAKRA